VSVNGNAALLHFAILTITERGALIKIFN